jgi:predicted DNA-binding protein
LGPLRKLGGPFHFLIIYSDVKGEKRYMSNDKQKKDTLLTIRMSREELDALDYISDYSGKTRSDTLTRAYKFFLNSGSGERTIEEEARGLGEERKNHKVHFRVPSNDADELGDVAEKYGVKVSRIVREAFKEYRRYVR